MKGLYSNVEMFEIKWVEDLSLLTASNTPGSEPTTKLPPGGMLEKSGRLKRHPSGSEVVKVEATVRMVVFDDGTAFGQKSEIEELRRSRQAAHDSLLAISNTAAAIVDSKLSQKEISGRIAGLMGTRSGADSYYPNRLQMLSRRFGDLLAQPRRIDELLNDWEHQRMILSVPIDVVHGDPP
jgi:hypothetical protein